MRRLIALAVPAGPRFPEELLRVWERGDAAFPLDLRLPKPAQEALLDEVSPSVVIDERGEETTRDTGRPVEEGDALVVATSGTTGDPRATVLTHHAVARAAVMTSARLGVDPSTDRWLACLPLAHVGGLSVVTRSVLSGTPVTLLDGADPAAIETAARRGATLVSLVATVLARVDASLFRSVLVGGSAPPSALPPNVVTTYGMTETMGGVVYDGSPLDGVEVSVRNDGLVRLRTPTLARAYRTANGEAPLPRDGDWFLTGDIGSLDVEDGASVLTVHGRSGEVIVTGGEKVWPAPLEGVLADHPKVADVAVSGAPDPEWGHRVVAHVVPTDASDPPVLVELREHVKASLAPWCAPKEMLLVASIPRDRLGKIRRADLVRKAAPAPGS